LTPGTPESKKNDEALSLSVSKGGQWGADGFVVTVSWVISWFIKTDLKQIYRNYSSNNKIQNDFV